jgi:hypothetical protein
LLGIDQSTSREFETQISAGCEIIKPGWTRFGLNYFNSEAETAFILDAINWVADNGHRLLPAYDCDGQTGRWWHKQAGRVSVMSLNDVNFDASGLNCPTHKASLAQQDFEDLKKEAEAAIAAIAPAESGLSGDPTIPAPARHLQWFPLPDDASAQQ